MSTTSPTTADPMPHLAELATADEVTVPLSDVTAAYQIGYLDARAEGIAREASGLRAIDDVRELRVRTLDRLKAGEIDPRERYRLDEIADKATATLEAAHVPQDCPSWCNAHTFSYGWSSPVDDVDHHVHRVEIAGSTIEVEIDDDTGQLEVLMPQTDAVSIPDARRVAVALLAACDAVETPTATV